MKCFRWKTRACSYTPDICEYTERMNFNDPITMTCNKSAVLLSPDHNDLVLEKDQSFGHHFFCVYNVSLNCPQNGVIIKTTEATNWPRQQDTSCHQSEGGCENYVAFYDDRNSSIISREFYGQENYTHYLNSDSFLAVMWTNAVKNEGIFEFLASCNTQEEFLYDEGSGNEEILNAP